MVRELGRCGLKIAVLVKQVPRAESLSLGADGRLQREGVELDMNAYCRRAVAKGVELARETGGSCTAFTLGPPGADDVLREAVAWGADSAVHICDPAFAGSDTLATARALCAALRLEGPFDLVLAGRNSVDADTGQVGPEVAELLDLPFVAGVREITIDHQPVATDGSHLFAEARCELDDGWRKVRVELPAVISAAERLCDPAKVDPEGRSAVDTSLIRRLGPADLGPGPWGAAGSPTSVGATRLLEVSRRRVVLAGPPDEQATRAVELLAEWGALERDPAEPLAVRPGGAAGNESADTRHAAVGGPLIAVIEEPGRPAVNAELTAEAARIALLIGGRVVLLAARSATSGVLVEEDVAAGSIRWCEARAPWAVIAPGTLWGREVASRVAARLGAGLTGDAVELDVDSGRLVCWKPAFGGRMVAAITASSPVQMVTIRPGRGTKLAEGIAVSDGIAAEGSAAPSSALVREILDVEPRRRVVVLEEERDDDVTRLLAARVVVTVGQGVDPSAYGEIEAFAKVLGAEMAATRKVTDKAWMPRARQVGLTGHSVAPDLYVALGVSGKFNHMVATRAARVVVAVNPDPEAPIFEWADVGITADWREAVPQLAEHLSRKLAAHS